MPRRRDSTQVQEAARLYASGKTSREIGAELGRAPRTIERWLGDAARRRGPRPRADVKDQLILDLKDREGLSFAEIGRRVHMSTTGARMRYYALTGRDRPDRVKPPPTGTAHRR